MIRLAATVLGCLVLAACSNRMQNQYRHKPLDSSPFFADGRSARPLVDGTVARGHLDEDEQLDTGKVNGKYATTFPFPVTQAVLQRGRERFNIFCAPCHDRTGHGRGMVVRRGFKAPASYHEQRVRDMPNGYFVDVMTQGFGVMPSYALQVPARDRWAITAYIRALQLSQNATVKALPAADRRKLEEMR